jgi:inner membrane protein
LHRTAHMRDSWLARAVVVLLLLAVLLVPLRMIEGLVAEREARRRAAVDEIGATWGGPQTLIGPVLVLPHRVLRRENVVLAPPPGAAAGTPGVVQERTRVEVVHAAFLPDRLKVDGTLVPERRRRGIFEVVVYAGLLAVSGTIPATDVRSLGLDPDDVAFADAFLSVALTDTRGIREEPVLLFDGARVEFRPGAGDSGLGAAGLHASLPAFDPGKPHTFSFTLRLQGTESLSVAPLGASTEAALASAWPSPSFSGAFLPETRRTGPEGFSAAWRVSSFGRAYHRAGRPVRRPKPSRGPCSARGCTSRPTRTSRRRAP